MDQTLEIDAAAVAKSPKGLGDLWYSRGGTAFRGCLSAVLYRLFRLVGELTAVVLGLGITASWIAVSILDRQSTDLTVLRPNVKIWFAQVFEGHDAEFGRLEVTWLPTNDQFVVTIEDAEIRGKDGEVLEHFELIRSTLAADGGWLNRPRIVNAEVKGGALTYLEDAEGRIVAGLGLPDTVGRVGPVYRNNQSSGADFDFDNLTQGIEFIQISDADLYVRNGVSGIDLKSDVESFRAVFSDAGNLTVAANGTIDQELGKMPYSITSVVDQDQQDIKMRVKLAGARPDQIAPTKGRFWEIQGLAAPVDLMAEVDFSREVGLRSSEVELSIGAGEFTLLRDNDPRSFALESLKARAALAPGEERMDIGQLDLDSPNLTFKASGFLSELGKLSDGDVNSSPTFELSFGNIRVDMTPQFSTETNIENLNVVGQADVDSRQLTIERGSFDYFDSIHEFNGKAVLDEVNQPKSIVFNSAMSGTLTPEQFLLLWPVEAFGGARRWIDRSILSGRMTQLDAGVSLDEEFFANPSLTDERLSLRFAGQDIDVKYMETMPQASGVRGSGELIGNRLSATFSGGAIDGVPIIDGTVDIPVLLPKGGNINILANGTGRASDLLRVADHPPFEIARRYDADPSKLLGQGDINIEVTRPLLEFFPREDIVYQVKGDFTGVNAPFKIGKYEIANGSVNMDANGERVIISGPVDIGPWRANMRWQETFGDIEYLTQYGISGIMTAEVLDKFGFASRSWFDGNAAVLVEAEGRGMDIATATVDIDLTNSDLSAERIWMKPSGEPARLVGNLTRTPDNGFSFENASIKGEGIDVRGRLELDADYKPKDIALSNIQIASFIDGALRITPDREVGQLGVEIDARYLNVSPWTEELFAERQSNLDVPLALRGDIERLVLDPDYIVTNSVIDFSHTGEVIETARLEALSDGEPLKLELLTRENLKREMSAVIPDASKAISAFLGMDNTSGGSLEVNVNLPAAGEEGAYDGEADMRNFKIIEAPAMAKLLSLASLTGLADTLTSGSMQVEKFKLPFTMLGDDIAIRDARLYGPALGMTANGDIDLELRVVDFDGTLVPAYTANSILGDIPVLGDLFVQEKDGGLFALTYTVSGPFEQTQIAVNPLSALTPGFLRNIFRRDRSEIDDAMRAAIEDVTPKQAEEP